MRLQILFSLTMAINSFHGLYAALWPLLSTKIFNNERVSPVMKRTSETVKPNSVCKTLAFYRCTLSRPGWFSQLFIYVYSSPAHEETETTMFNLKQSQNPLDFVTLLGSKPINEKYSTILCNEYRWKIFVACIAWCITKRSNRAKRIYGTSSFLMNDSDTSSSYQRSTRYTRRVRRHQSVFRKRRLNQHLHQPFYDRRSHGRTNL